MSYKITGTLKVKNDTVQVSQSFSKREFVLTDDSSKYPQDIQFQLSQDKCSLLDTVNQGDKVTVSFGLKGREWINPQGEAKYFNTLDAWKIEKEVPTTNGFTPNSSAPVNPIPNAETQDANLPF